jgi:hypothetical protein
MLKANTSPWGGYGRLVDYEAQARQWVGLEIMSTRAFAGATFDSMGAWIGSWVGASQIARFVVHWMRTILALSSGASERHFALLRRSCPRRRWGLCIESESHGMAAASAEVGEA